MSSYFGDGNKANSAYAVKKVSISDYSKATLVEGGEDGGYFKLYKTIKPDGYDCVLTLGTKGGKAFRYVDGNMISSLEVSINHSQSQFNSRGARMTMLFVLD